ncbi:MAG: hypothetical protein ABI390_10500, partial [Daejeonella sp.]
VLNIFIVIFLITIVLFACHKREEILPLTIQELIATNQNNCSCNPYINQYNWKNATVYVASCGGPACDCTISFYDEKGNAFQLKNGYSYSDFQKDANLVKSVWSCK